MTKEEKEKEQAGEISRRDFLKDAGFVVGGAAIGAGITYPLVSKDTVTETKTVEVAGPTKTVPTTVEVPGPTKTVEVPGPTKMVTVEKTVTVEVPVAGELTNLTINGSPHKLKVEPNWTLAEVLRDKLALTGTKLMCQRGSCGYCTVIMDGRPVLACMVLAIDCDGKSILTIEGLAKGGTLHPVQQAYIDEMGYQCGACVPGMIMETKALLDKNPSPTEADIRVGMSGNLCICGNYNMIQKSVQNAAKKGVS